MWMLMVMICGMWHLSTAVQYDMCDISNLNPGGVGSEGVITSRNYPGNIPDRQKYDNNCRFTMTACPHCQFELNFTDVVLPPCNVEQINYNGCHAQCDHLMLYEPGFEEETTQFVFGSDDSGLIIHTVSNRIHMVFCHTNANNGAVKRFKMEFIITEKHVLFNGSVDGLNSSGTFTSPFFPRRYVINDEVYTYLIQNTNPDGLIRLGFDDWSLSPHSRLTIYFHDSEHSTGYVTRRGDEARPFVLSSGPNLFVKFETGTDLVIGGIPYLGFKANYTFVNQRSWPEKPYSVCGEYYHLLLGGNFDFNTHKCWPGDKIDCIWVVFKYCFTYNIPYCNDQGSHLSLRIDEFIVLADEGDSLEIRAGNSSEAELIGIYQYNNLTGTDLVRSDAYYLRFRTTCSNNRHFRAVFATFTVPNSEGRCSYDDRQFACNNHRCIANTLKCDGIDHCGDASDEQHCQVPTSPSRCTMYKMCLDGVGWYCPQEACDFKWDCVDGSDEQDCWMTETSWPSEIPSEFSGYHWATFVPVGLVFFLMAIIVCIIISCCARRKRNAMLRRQRAQSSGMSGNSLPSGSETQLNINVEIQHYPDAPPTYDEAMRYNPNFGICNLGYISSESADALPAAPPPYTSDPYPILNSVAISQAASAPATVEDRPSLQHSRARDEPHHRRRHRSGSAKSKNNRASRPRRRQRSRESPENNDHHAVATNPEMGECESHALEECNTDLPHSEGTELTNGGHTNNTDNGLPTSTAITKTIISNSRHKKGQDSGSGASLDGVCKTETIPISEGEFSSPDDQSLSKHQDENEREASSHSAEGNNERSISRVDNQDSGNLNETQGQICESNMPSQESDEAAANVKQSNTDVPPGGDNNQVPPTEYSSNQDAMKVEDLPGGASFV